MTAESTSFLYPFIEGEERDAAGLEAELIASARAKMADSGALRRGVLEAEGSRLDRAAAELAHRFLRGGRLFTMGNGGSATDAEGMAALFSTPPAGDPWPAASLTTDTAVLTALANDVGFEQVFARQLTARAAPGDSVVGFSTSGDSENLLRAFARARSIGALTIGLAGYDGGAMAASDDLDYCFVVGSDSVHRIQEAQDALAFALWSGVHDRTADRGRAAVAG